MATVRGVALGCPTRKTSVVVLVSFSFFLGGNLEKTLSDTYTNILLYIH